MRHTLLLQTDSMHGAERVRVLVFKCDGGFGLRGRAASSSWGIQQHLLAQEPRNGIVERLLRNTV